MTYGYARVSTSGQEKNGNSLESQCAVLKAQGTVEIFKEAFTGTKEHRPQWDELLAVIQPGDTLIVTKLDRIARSAVNGCHVVEELLDKGVVVNVLNMGTMDNTPTGKLIRTIFFAFAEFERDMIVTRTTEGKEIARKKTGYREGRPIKQVEGFQKLAQKQKDGLITVEAACRELGIGRTKYYELVKGARI